MIEASDDIVKTIPRAHILKFKLEVDTDPPPGFETRTRYLLQPIPFEVRAFSLPDLFAGKMHAILCRRWKNRVKGRDWYDLIWYAANHPKLHLHHLEQRMRQTKDWDGDAPLTSQRCLELFTHTIGELNIAEARRDVEPFVKHPENLSIWSPDFFRMWPAKLNSFRPTEICISDEENHGVFEDLHGMTTSWNDSDPDGQIISFDSP